MREPVREPKPVAQPELLPTVEEIKVLEQTEGGSDRKVLDHETAIQQVRQLRHHLEVQRTHLEQSRGALRKLFDRVRDWWKKEEGMETAVARLAIEMDHVEDKIKQATPEQLDTHLKPELARLQEQIERIQLASVEVNQFVENQSEETLEAAENFPTELAGGIKKSWQGQGVERMGKLGRFGQDVLRANPELGIGVVADGASTGPDSYEIARRSSRRAEALLEDLPIEQFQTLEQLEQHLEVNLQVLLDEIKAMPAAAIGATTLLAARYIEKFDAVVMIDIGDCEGAVVIGDQVINLKENFVHSRANDFLQKGIVMKQKEKIKGVDLNGPVEVSSGGDAAVISKVEIKKVTKRPLVHSLSLKNLRVGRERLPIHVLLASDGWQNNRGKTLVESAQEIMAKGVQAAVAEVGTEQDDLTLLKMALPGLIPVKAAA